MKIIQKIIIGIAFIVFLSECGIIFYHYYFVPKEVKKNVTTYQQPVTTPKPTTTQNPVVVPATKYYYPMTNYDNRVTFRYYGLYVTAAQKASPCGAAFVGYHDGDDLEVTSAELNAAVPVYAISDGVVKQVGHVSGYGGLMVLATNINGADYTVYYGHINLGSTNLQSGDTVKAGDKLAELGAACSAQTDGERKHLHFAIHKGTAVDVRGYAPDLTTLANWINPKQFLSGLLAK